MKWFLKGGLSLLLLLSFSSRAQIHYGGGVFIGMSKVEEPDYKRWDATSVGFWFPISYRVKEKWVVESGFQFDGNLVVPILAGRRFKLGEEFDIHLLGGISDNILYSPHPFQLIHKFYWTALVRVQWKDFYVMVNNIGNSHYNMGMGIYCKWNKQ